MKRVRLTKKNHSLVAFNLIDGIDVPAIEAKIAKYQEENAEQIMINRARKVLQNKITVFYPFLSFFWFLTCWLCFMRFKS